MTLIHSKFALAGRLLAGLGIIASVAAPAAAVVPIEIRVETQAPGLQATTATFSVGGVENFDARNSGSGQLFSTDFGTGGAIKGSYSGVDVLGADVYGGAGGTGNYAVTFSSEGYSLDLTSTIAGGINYFGYWLSALDAGNNVKFFSKGKLLFTFDPVDVLNAISTFANPGSYFGNPNAPHTGANSGEPYVFLNFFNNQGSFDRIVFAETPQSGGYESDNHTVGHFLTKGTGTVIETAAVPEAATWLMLIGGFAMVGMSRRRLRSVAA